MNEVIWHYHCENEFEVANAREFYRRPACPFCDSKERFYKVSSTSFCYAYEEKQREKQNQSLPKMEESL